MLEVVLSQHQQPSHISVLYSVDGSANCQPPTSSANQRGEPGALFRTISQWAGWLLSLLTAHLVPVWWQCHVHSGFVSFKEGGGDTHRRERGATSSRSTQRHYSLRACWRVQAFICIIYRNTGVMQEVNREGARHSDHSARDNKTTR